MRPAHRDSGLSLLEAIISIFILAGAILMSGALLQSSFQYQSRSKQRVEATVLAQRIMAEVKAWAWRQSGGKYNFNTDWSPYRSAQRTEGGFTIRIESSPGSVTLASPCTALEAHFGSEGRSLNSSVVPVRVTIDWGTSETLSLLTYVGEPPRIADRVVVRQTGGSTGPNGISQFSARAFDAAGEEIPDMMFRWYLQPTSATPGMGSLLPPWGGQLLPPVPMGPRDGRTASVKNTFRREDGTWTVVGGNVSVQAMVQGHGRERVGETIVRLSP